MQLVGSLIGERRGRLGLLAGLVIALAALLAASASDAATARAKGLDVSNYQGTINWTKVANAGYRFAFGKATEGTSYNDKTYAKNRNGSEAAGLVFGAYHFARPGGKSFALATAGAIRQANHFLAVAQPQPGELPPVLDLEQTGSLSKQRLLGWALAWLDQIYARTGVEPFVYTSRSSGSAASATRPRPQPTARSSGSRTGRRRASRPCRPRTGTEAAGGSGSGRTAPPSRGSSTAATATG
jgi:hypothetical protein